MYIDRQPHLHMLFKAPLFLIEGTKKHEIFDRNIWLPKTGCISGSFIGQNDFVKLFWQKSALKPQALF